MHIRSSTKHEYVGKHHITYLYNMINDDYDIYLLIVDIEEVGGGKIKNIVPSKVKQII